MLSMYFIYRVIAEDGDPPQKKQALEDIYYKLNLSSPRYLFYRDI
jgi:hypothetical protein